MADASAPNPYHDLVSEVVRLRELGRALPLGGWPPPPHIPLADDAPKVLIFSPHPDDECIIGGMALRLLREARWRVINVAVTQGSKKERQAGRLEELRHACEFLQFDLLTTAPGGLSGIHPRNRHSDPAGWNVAVDVTAAILAAQQPRVILFPHELDWNGTHVGTHHLVLDALGKLPPDFRSHTLETEFWGQMPTPNLMVESSAADVGDLMAACSFHVGEVRRNPYHVIQTSWMQDNVRRGSELVGGQGGAAPDFTFATLYRLRVWENGELRPFHSRGRNLALGTDPTSIFENPDAPAAG